MAAKCTLMPSGEDSRVLNGKLLKTLSIRSPSITNSSSSSSTSSPPSHLMSSLKITTTNLLPNKPMIDELPYDQSGLLLTTAKPAVPPTTSAVKTILRDQTPTSSFVNSSIIDRPAKRPTKLFDSEPTTSSRFSEFYNQFPLKSSSPGDSLMESAKLNLIQRELNPFPSRKSLHHAHSSMIPSSSSSSCSSSSLSTLSSLSTISTPPLSPSETLSSQGKCRLSVLCWLPNAPAGCKRRSVSCPANRCPIRCRLRHERGQETVAATEARPHGERSHTKTQQSANVSGRG